MNTHAGISIAKYCILPGILPRIAGLFKSGFVHIAYFIALVYANVRLLPPNHPYLDPRNIGHYGIRHVIAQAANNLVFTRKNTDQILIFFTVLSGLVLLALQFVLLGVALWADHAAYALDPRDLFVNPNAHTGSKGPAQDMAFIVLDRVFGVKDMFMSCISDLNVACTDLRGNDLPSEVTTFPFPFHIALHKIFQFYSMGIFIVSVFVILYFVTTIVAESAQSGTAFGKRFNKAWAPIRLIVFFALITPLNIGGPNEGLNGAQIITFKVAKVGSNFATNAWSFFNGAGTDKTASMSTNTLTQQQKLVAEPNLPEITGLLQALYVARTCSSAYALGYGKSHKIEAFIVRAKPPGGMESASTPHGAPLTPDAMPFDTTSFQNALDFSLKGNITIRFGKLAEEDPKKAGSLLSEYTKETGAVKPFCGDVMLQTAATNEPGAFKIQEAYYKLVHDIWMDPDFIKQGECRVKSTTSYSQNPNCKELNNPAFAQDKITQYTEKAKAAIKDGLKEQEDKIDEQAKGGGGTSKTPKDIDILLEKGWAGGAIWYNRIAAMNGAVTSATFNMPQPLKLPLLMDMAVNANRKQNTELGIDDKFAQGMTDIAGVSPPLDISDKDSELLTPMRDAYDFWRQNGDLHANSYKKPTGNAFIDFVNGLLGSSGLYDMRKNTDVHPLAQLSALGKGLLEAAMRNAAYATAFGVGANLGEALAPFVGDAGKAVQSFLFTLVQLTISIGVLLYYILPFLPFIYFFFAMGAWIKSIFEAIVAMPLWALAHIRIDGEGLPGQAAASGYYLLLEIFLRPVLILFGLLASISIFAALVNVMNQIFDVVTANAAGIDHELESKIAAGQGKGIESTITSARTGIDEFFYTVLYAVICYMLAISSFKLIDQIPGTILRWIGASASPLKESGEGPAGQISEHIYEGMETAKYQLTNNIQGTLSQMTGFAKT